MRTPAERQIDRTRSHVQNARYRELWCAESIRGAEVERRYAADPESDPGGEIAPGTRLARISLLTGRALAWDRLARESWARAAMNALRALFG